METHRGVATDLVGERLESLGETLRSERRTMQVSDQRPDPIGRVLLRLRIFSSCIPRPPSDPSPAACGDVDLDREAEQHLREVVVEVPRDLLSFVGPFLGHRVRERTKDLLAILEFLVSLFERLRSEEHLPREQQGSKDCWQCPEGQPPCTRRPGSTQRGRVRSSSQGIRSGAQFAAPAHLSDGHPVRRLTKTATSPLLTT